MNTTVWYDIKMTSNNTPTPYVISASSMFNANYDGWKAFDGLLANADGSARWLTKDGTKIGHITIKLDKSRVINLIRTDMSQNGSSLFPTKMAIHGSNDGATFNKIVSFNRPIESLTEQEFDNNTPYLYYKIEILANNGGNYTGITEIRFGYIKQPINKSLILNDGEYKKWNSFTPQVITIGDNIVPIMTSNTAPIGIASASGYTSVNYEPWNAFSSNTSIWWRVDYTLSEGSWLSYQFNEPKTIAKYSIFFPLNQSSNTAPKTWDLEGSNDNSVWTVVDTQTNITNWISGETRTFTFNNIKPFKSYRLNIKSNNGHSTIIIIGRLQLFEVISYESEIQNGWKVVSSIIPKSNQFTEQGMDKLSPLLDRKVTELEPLPMSDKSEILGVGDTGKVFSKTVDLKKYFDIRSMKVEAK